MSKKLSSSSDRYTFQARKSNGQLDDDFWEQVRNSELVKEQDPEWQKDNLEYDLRTTDWILEKVRTNDTYAQNLYAAMCNNDFQRADLWPILTDKFWHCSWRYAGGIIAHMRQRGDYIDWYCSGIRNEAAFNGDTNTDIVYDEKKYVPESVVTEEIENDLGKLGWIVIQNNHDTDI